MKTVYTDYGIYIYDDAGNLVGEFVSDSSDEIQLPDESDEAQTDGK